MGHNLQAINDIVLRNRQSFALKPSQLTDRDRMHVDEVTVIETIKGQITIDRRITKEGSHDNSNNNSRIQ